MPCNLLDAIKRQYSRRRQSGHTGPAPSAEDSYPQGPGSTTSDDSFYSTVEDESKYWSPSSTPPQSSKCEDNIFAYPNPDDDLSFYSTFSSPLPVVPKTHYIKKEQDRLSARKPWAYRPHQGFTKPGYQNVQGTGSFSADEDAQLRNSDTFVWITTYLPLFVQPKKKKKTPTKIPSDKYVNVPSIPGLNGMNFDDFIRQKDITLVLFYNSSVSARGDFQDHCKRQFAQAAELTKRDNHAYAALDCFNNRGFCTEIGVKRFPLLRIYSRDKCLGIIKNNFVKDKLLRDIVEVAPVAPVSQ